MVLSQRKAEEPIPEKVQECRAPLYFTCRSSAGGISLVLHPAERHGALLKADSITQHMHSHDSSSAAEITAGLLHTRGLGHFCAAGRCPREKLQAWAL